MTNELESVGSCELISEILKIAEELNKRPSKEFDLIDIHRIQKIISILNTTTYYYIETLI